MIGVIVSLPLDNPPEYCQKCGSRLVARQGDNALASYDPVTGERKDGTSIAHRECPAYSPREFAHHDRWWLPDGSDSWLLRV